MDHMDLDVQERPLNKLTHKLLTQCQQDIFKIRRHDFAEGQLKLH